MSASLPAAPLSPENENNASIELDPEFGDGDSAYAQSLMSDTTTLSSSVLHYKWENGRRYTAAEDTKYWGPNDDKQQDVESLLHELHKLILDNKLHQSPLTEPKTALDVGCGTGSWAIEFADKYTACTVTGVDLSPIQPSFVPPNCRFVVDDINKPWTYPENHFDFVHVRNMLGTVPSWADFHQNTFKHVKPGGWVEQVELSCITRSDDDSIPPGSAISKWPELFVDIGKKFGVSFHASEEARAAISDAGFVNVTERVIKVPLGPWPRDPKLKVWGQWYRYSCLEGLEGFALRSMVDVLNWSYESAQLFLAEMRRNLKDPRIHSYTNLVIVSGQKPEASEES
ncbi:hypothetical protein jhhlp_000321 [Lomentospora prolificans]|uniref:Methyltransferase domain-containing protein n=1 Tax=Lomentospora prolificans TaxID=41688 RepID=A0A2N3NKM3_9PEZI|nr:hypothetical protein jhhlp_000321 [Lomentospora prolificans]